MAGAGRCKVERLTGGGAGLDATCHYCERPAGYAVLLRSGATEQVLVQRQRLCEAHDAIVSSLRTVVVLERRRWHDLPEREANGTVLAGAGPAVTITDAVAASRPATASGGASTPTPPARASSAPRRRWLPRSLVGR